METPWRPTPKQIASAAAKRIPDVLAPKLDLLFCGINPSLFSAAVGHHFARPGNRFWPALHRSGFTPRQFSPFEDASLLDLKLGLTNIAPRASARADELSATELLAGAKSLERKLARYKPRYLAILGVTAYRTAFDQTDATLGLQDTQIAHTQLWILPNPSGLNAHYALPALAELFSQLKHAVSS